ncbi:hypothetical protein [Leifsonia sp. Root112D2]|jgi:hypothetical protein|uniref:hypothetical protein n=1 Tax=Leifsonia sp. Root112D2 TaxID=1736426 RepID=UPI0006F92529|nr:hypothetical protein [Leifsonia sp. Root112D2]KQV06897.1 hypothetical protein ASC63_05910 [Leifsonia sp. Root112D2]
MADTPVPHRPRTALFCLCLITAPLAEAVEAILSPLTGGSTGDDFAAIAAAPARFTVAVLVGLVGTILLFPALLGLAHRASARSPRLALVAACAVVVSLVGFAGIRMAQAFELQLATGGQADAVVQFEGAVGNTIGATLTVMFLGGNVIGIILLVIALWRSRRVPIPAVLLFLLFPIADLLVPGHVGPIVSHLVLLAATSWMAVGFLRAAPARRGRYSTSDSMGPAASSSSTPPRISSGRKG